MSTKDIINFGYHYTSVETFFKMLDGIEDHSIIFHASSVFSMNDFSEFEYGYNKIWNILPMIEKELSISNPIYQLSKMAYKDKTMDPQKLQDELLKYIKKSTQCPFIISYSKKLDYLPQWTLYGGDGNGVALGMDIQKYLPKRNLYDGDDGVSYLNLDNLNALPVTYGKIEANDSIRVVIKNHYKKYYDEVTRIENNNIAEFQLNKISDIFLVLSALIKHEAFEYEQESRLLKYLGKADELCFKTNAKGRIVPYIKVKIPLCYLKKVIVGPCCNNEHSIRMKLMQCGLSNVEVTKSLIPYR